MVEENVEMLKIGLISAAHVHTPSYATHFAQHPQSQLTGVWDDDASRGKRFAEQFNLKFVPSLDLMLEASDAVAISSENTKHLNHIWAAASAGKHILCEKPVVVQRSDFEMVRQVTQNIQFMTAFPCRFSPVWKSAKDRILRGEIGNLLAIQATNRGQCPHLWFTQPHLSGGGAMIDHVVHVADLLFDLMQVAPISVDAQIGSNMYGGLDWDDTAMLTLRYADGCFVTLDSSWSRPKSFRTWGDVTLKFVGEKGSLYVDLFGQGLTQYRSNSPTCVDAAYGSDLDAAMVDAFIQSCLKNQTPPVTLEHGLQAVEVALRGYEVATLRAKLTTA